MKTVNKHYLRKTNLDDNQVLKGQVIQNVENLNTVKSEFKGLSKNFRSSFTGGLSENTSSEVQMQRTSDSGLKSNKIWKSDLILLF